MTRQTMIDAAKSHEPRSPIYGIGICKSAGDFVDYEIGWGDYERDVARAKKQLLDGGVVAGDHVLITTSNHELALTGPVVKALRSIGAVYTPAEIYGWDASRFTFMLTNLPITVVIGVGGDTLSAVRAQTPDLGALFSGVRMVWARPEAHAALLEANIDSRAFAFLGPALALASKGAPNELQVDSAEWDVRESATGLLVSSTDARHDSVVDAVADVTGSVVGRTDTDILVRI